MFIFFILVSQLIFSIGTFPTGYVRGIEENHHFDEAENYLPKFDELSYNHYFENYLENDLLPKLNATVDDEYQNKTELRTDIVQINSTYVTESPKSDTNNYDEGAESKTVLEEDTASKNNSLLVDASLESNRTYRLAKQDFNDTRGDPEFESQEEDSSEENENMITGLLSAFLGGLSRPDGSIDLEAIIGILGSLSTQNEDGTYDFQGLTDLVKGFFGGGGDEGGGSDIGAFIGGLLGAFIKGVANPPGAKGAGIFTGKVVVGILPALSGPVSPMEDMDGSKLPSQTLESGGFLSGLLKTILGSSSGVNSQGEGGGSSFNFFKIIFSTITSIFSSSSKSH